MLSERLKNAANRATAWAFFDQGLMSACNFATTLISAYLLAPTQYAQLSLALLSVQFLSSFHRAIVTQPLNILGASEDRISLHHRYQNLLIFHGLALPLAAALLAMIGWVFFKDIALIIAACSFLFAFFLQELVRRFYYTDSNVKHAFRNDLISYLGQIALILMLWLAAMPSPASVMSALAASSLMAYFVGQKHIAKTKLRIEAHYTEAPVLTSVSFTVIEQCRFAKWVVLSQFVFWAATQAYPFIMARQESYDVVADFIIANSILNALNVIRLTVGNHLPTQANNVLRRDGTDALRSFMWRSIAAYGGAALAAILVITATADWLVTLLFGNKYPLAAQLIVWLAIAHFVTVIGAVMNSVGLAMGSTKWSFFGNAIATVFTIALGPSLVSKYGVWGAVAGLVIGSVVPTLIQGTHVVRSFTPSTSRNQ